MNLVIVKTLLPAKVALPQAESKHNLRVLLDSWLLFKEQVAATAKSSLHTILLCTSCATSWVGLLCLPPCIYSSDPNNMLYLGLPLKNTETSTGTECQAFSCGTAIAQPTLASGMLLGTIQGADYHHYSPAWHKTWLFIGSPISKVFCPVHQI